MNEMHDHTTDDQPTRQHARRLSHPVLIALGVTVVFGAALAGILAAVTFTYLVFGDLWGR